MNDKLETLRWIGGPEGYLTLLDQTRLPAHCTYLECRNVDSVVHAIRTLQVRGAPAIGVAAAYGVVLALRGERLDNQPTRRLVALTALAVRRLAASRPTAVNLFWALRRMVRRMAAARHAESGEAFRQALWEEACAIHAEDRQVCREIGRHGAPLIPNGAAILTHCNAGWLATSEYGTALSIVYTAQDQGKKIRVYAGETRPLLQGARLTAWELRRRGVPTTLICDSMAAQVMREGRVQLVITGADRIAANGDTANKIGTYGLAQLARAHGIPFYIAAPTSTFDLAVPDGEGIPIEQRSADEIIFWDGRQIAPAGVDVYNPAFDVTPASLITAIVCEHGVIKPVNGQTIRNLLEIER